MENGIEAGIKSTGWANNAVSKNPLNTYSEANDIELIKIILKNT